MHFQQLAIQMKQPGDLINDLSDFLLPIGEKNAKHIISNLMVSGLRVHR